MVSTCIGRRTVVPPCSRIGVRKPQSSRDSRPSSRTCTFLIGGIVDRLPNSIQEIWGDEEYMRSPPHHLGIRASQASALNAIQCMAGWGSRTQGSECPGHGRDCTGGGNDAPEMGALIREQHGLCCTATWYGCVHTEVQSTCLMSIYGVGPCERAWSGSGCCSSNTNIQLQWGCCH